MILTQYDYSINFLQNGKEIELVKTITLLCLSEIRELPLNILDMNLDYLLCYSGIKYLYYRSVLICYILFPEFPFRIERDLLTYCTKNEYYMLVRVQEYWLLSRNICCYLSSIFVSTSNFQSVLLKCTMSFDIPHSFS